MNKMALIVSVLCGVAGFVLLSRHQQRFEAATSGGPPTPVVVARADIPLGSVVTEDMVALRNLPASYVEDRHVRGDELSKIIGVHASSGVRAGESVLWTDLAAGQLDRRDLSGLVLEGMRAVTIRTANSNTLGGLLRPGDRVDVLMTARADRSERETRPLVQNLLVLAVGTEMGRVGGNGLAAASLGRQEITLSGTMTQAQSIVHAGTVAELSVVLRNPEDLAVMRSPPATRDRDLLSGTQLERIQGGHPRPDEPQLPVEIDGD